MTSNINNDDFNSHDFNEIQSRNYPIEVNNSPLLTEILEELRQLNSQITEIINEVGAQKNVLNNRAGHIQNHDKAIKKQSITIQNLVQ